MVTGVCVDVPGSTIALVVQLFTFSPGKGRLLADEISLKLNRIEEW